MGDDERDVEEVIADRRAANPRHTPGREPTGAPSTRRLIRATASVLVAATIVLVVVLVLGS